MLRILFHFWRIKERFVAYKYHHGVYRETFFPMIIDHMMTRKDIACHSHVVIRDTLVLLFEKTTWSISTKNVQLPLVVQFIIQDQCHVPSEVQFGGESTRGEVTHEQLRFPQGWAGEKRRGALLSWSTQVWSMLLFVCCALLFFFSLHSSTSHFFLNLLTLFRTLYALLTNEPAVGDSNSAEIVAVLRNMSEILIWGDKNDPSVFECFLEKHMLANFVSILQQCGVVFTRQSGKEEAAKLTRGEISVKRWNACGSSRLIGWLVDWLVDWSIGWLVDWSIDWLICSVITAAFVRKAYPYL